MGEAHSWFKSSYSGNEGSGACVETAFDEPGTVHVRNSTDPQGPSLTFTTEAWTAFISDADLLKPRAL